MDFLEHSRAAAADAVADDRVTAEEDAPRAAQGEQKGDALLRLAADASSEGRHEEARRRLARARSFFAAQKDAPSVARCDDVLARVFTAEGRLEEAERAATEAVRGLEGGERRPLLAEALTTLGVAQARAGRLEDARRSLRRAAQTAEAAGDRTCAGAAALAHAEELSAHMTSAELCEAYARAYDLLAGTHDPATLERLSACARRAVGSLSSPPRPSAPRDSADGEWDGFSLKAEVLRYESELIGRALQDADGVVSRAAKLLGFRHHQTFVALLNNRHKDLLHARTPIVPRRRSLVRPRRANDSHGD